MFFLLHMTAVQTCAVCEVAEILRIYIKDNHTQQPHSSDELVEPR